MIIKGNNIRVNFRNKTIILTKNLEINKNLIINNKIQTFTNIIQKMNIEPINSIKKNKIF